MRSCCEKRPADGIRSLQDEDLLEPIDNAVVWTCFPKAVQR